MESKEENELASDAALLKELEKDLEEDSDSAPEEVTFTKGNRDTLALLKNVQNQVRKSQAKLKEERRRLQEKYVTQKTKKQQYAEALESKKLSDEFLQQISAEEPMKKVNSLEETSGYHAHNRRHHPHTDSDEDISVGKHGSPDTEEFISLCGTTEFHVSVLENEMKKAKSLSERAKQFRNQSLYGKRIKRHSSQASFLGEIKKRVISGHIKQ